MKKILFLVLIICVCVLIVYAFYSQKHTVVADGAKPVRLCGDFLFTEGPAVDKDGNVYFTDQPANRIYKWTEKDGKLSVFMDSSNRSNGMYFDRNGNLISCADLYNQLVSIDSNKKITVLVNDFNGKLLNGPNDLWIDRNGGIYITDPFFKRPWWKRNQMPQDDQCVYYLSPDRQQLIRVIDHFEVPNGIVGAPDNKTLYVSDIKASKTYAYTILPDGKLTDQKLLFKQGSDGMTIDELGNIYATGSKGVTVYDKEGNKIDHITIDERWTANVCFCGKKRDKLFITASKSVYIIDMKVKGVN